MAESSEHVGCWGALFKIMSRPKAAAPTERTVLADVYRLRDDFLSEAERSFLTAQRTAVDDNRCICPKVNLRDIFFVVAGESSQGYRNKIDRKHVDFLLCDATSMRPLVGIELDDSSHARKKRQDRDAFVDQVFDAAGLPLLHVKAAYSYAPADLRRRIEDVINQPEPQAAATPNAPQAGVPICPKCRVAMVQRTASRGPNKGQAFFGCVNYPKCRETTGMQPGS